MSSVPRKSKLQRTMEKYRPQVEQAILSGKVVDATGILDEMPPPEKVREELCKPPFNITNRSFRVILVEDLGDYKVYIQVPGDKTEYDFFVWYAIFRSNRLHELKIPSHNDLGNMFIELKKLSPILDEYLVNATIRFIRDRMGINDIIRRYFASLPNELIHEVKKFLLTLKWVALQEDANYPPPENLGSLYTLSVYALLEIFGDLSVLRKIIRFGRARC